MDDDPIEPEDENEAMEWRASEQVRNYDQKIMELKIQLQQMKVERNRWMNLERSLQVARIQMDRARQMVISNSFSVSPSFLDAPSSPSVSSSGPPTQS